MGVYIDNRNENLLYMNNYKLIKFPEHNGMIPILMDYYMDLELDNNTNNFAKSKMLNYLNRNLLPKFEDAFGADNIVEFETDLMALDGDNSYGIIKSKISIPTIGFYDNNREIFDKYDGWYWWTATPYDTFSNKSVCITAHDGDMYMVECYRCSGIRPLIMVKASVFNR